MRTISPYNNSTQRRLNKPLLGKYVPPKNSNSRRSILWLAYLGTVLICLTANNTAFCQNARSSWQGASYNQRRGQAETSTKAVAAPQTETSRQPLGNLQLSDESHSVLKPIFQYENSTQLNPTSFDWGYNSAILPQTDRFQPFHGAVNSVEAAMIQDSRDNSFDRFTLLEAAIIAGGTTEQSALDNYKQKYRNCVYQIARLMPTNSQAIAKARILLEYMHRELFKDYLLESSNVASIFDSGIYNCVTGTALFNSFARQFGVKAEALELPGHAMSRIYLEDGTHYDVETTCAIWFQLRDYPGKQEQVIARMLEAGVASQVADDPVVRRQINDVELVAKLYYNRGVSLLNKEDYSGALQCNAKALSLDSQSYTAKGNFLATINNWAISESKDEHYDVAMNLLRQGMAIDPQYPIFKNNHIHIYHQWIEKMCKQSRFDEALRLSRQAISEAPSEEHFRKLEAYALMGLQHQNAVAGNAGNTSASVSATVAYPHN